MLAEMNTKQLICSFCFDVWKQKQLSFALITALSPVRPLYRECTSKADPDPELANKMHFSSVLVSPILLLQFCFRTLRNFLSSVFSKVPWQTAPRLRGESPTLSPAPTENATVPTSVNYHFTRKCNYKCGFCFHTAKTSFVLPLEEAKRGLKLLKDSGK